MLTRGRGGTLYLLPRKKEGKVTFGVLGSHSGLSSWEYSRVKGPEKQGARVANYYLFPFSLLSNV